MDKIGNVDNSLLKKFKPLELVLIENYSFARLAKARQVHEHIPNIYSTNIYTVQSCWVYERKNRPNTFSNEPIDEQK